VPEKVVQDDIITHTC